jgi:hypothetical protein
VIVAVPGHTGPDPVFVNRQPWMAEGACVDLPPSEVDRLFFPEPPHNYSREARDMCNGCKVQPDCAVFGAGQEFGMWGGLTPKERDKA